MLHDFDRSQFDIAIAEQSLPERDRTDGVNFAKAIVIVTPVSLALWGAIIVVMSHIF